MSLIASIIALLAFIVALFTALGLLAGGKFLWWIIAFLALAILLGWEGWGRYIGPRS